MTAAQKERFAWLIEELCELRNECDAADRLELGCIILDAKPALERPCDETDPYDCIR